MSVVIDLTSKTRELLKDTRYIAMQKGKAPNRSLDPSLIAYVVYILFAEGLCGKIVPRIDVSYHLKDKESNIVIEYTPKGDVWERLANFPFPEGVVKVWSKPGFFHKDKLLFKMSTEDDKPSTYIRGDWEKRVYNLRRNQ